MAKKIPKAINLLEPMTAPDDVWTGMYNWIFDVGKYLLVGVQVVVLGVFFSRFILDRINNDLTEDINDQVVTLDKPFFKQGEIRYNNILDLSYDIDQAQQTQNKNATDIGGIISSIPREIELKRFTYSDGNVNLSLESADLEAIKDYENKLGTSPLYSDVKVSLTKSGFESEVEFTVSFKIAADFQDEG